MKVAYLGPEGSHSYAAAKLMFRFSPDNDRRNDELISAGSFDEVYDMLDNADVPVGVVPIENTVGGEIDANFERLFSGKYKIFREICLLLSHHLVMLPGVEPKDIKRILLHTQTKALCSEFLKKYPEWEEIFVSSTTEAAQFIKLNNDHETATIASTEAAKAYGLQVVEKNVANDKGNYTRFIAVVRELFDFPPGDADKCSLLFDVANKPGALQSALKCLADNSCNLSKIASRPIPGKSDKYRLFVDFTFSGCLDLDNFEKETKNLAILGIYKCGKEAKEK